jgi:CBS domain-containing protein
VKASPTTLRDGWFRDSACQRRHGKGTVKPYDNLGRAVDVMREHFVRRVPVVDEW